MSIVVEEAVKKKTLLLNSCVSFFSGFIVRRHDDWQIPPRVLVRDRDATAVICMDLLFIGLIMACVFSFLASQDKRGR